MWSFTVQYYSAQSAALQTTLWGVLGTRFEPGTGSLEAGTLTTTPPSFLFNLFIGVKVTEP